MVNIGNLGLVTQLHQTANDYPEHISEVTELGLETSPSTQIATPRLTAALIAFECKLERTLELGERRNLLVIGEVVHFHVRNGLIRDGKIDVSKLEPLGRLGGPNYTSIGDVITMAPQIRSINTSPLK